MKNEVEKIARLEKEYLEFERTDLFLAFLELAPSIEDIESFINIYHAFCKELEMKIEKEVRKSLTSA
jgi:hypothetical protein